MINSAVYDNIVGRVLLVMTHDKIIQHKADKKENCHITTFVLPSRYIASYQSFGGNSLHTIVYLIYDM